jgi:hypothetical protein
MKKFFIFTTLISLLILPSCAVKFNDDQIDLDYAFAEVE